MCLSKVNNAYFIAMYIYVYSTYASYFEFNIDSLYICICIAKKLMLESRRYSNTTCKHTYGILEIENLGIRTEINLLPVHNRHTHALS